jgi:LmbE family N-acetylglucosaminyl deacetylase
MAASGDTIISVVITDGRRAPDPNSIGPEKMAAVRRVESERAGALLGVRETKFFDLESVASEKAIIEATRKMCEVIGEFEPDEVYTLHPELDRHASHRTAGKICVEALKPDSDHNIKLWRTKFGVCLRIGTGSKTSPIILVKNWLGLPNIDRRSPRFLMVMVSPV